MSEQTMQSKKITISLILSWIFGVLFVLIGIAFVFSDPIPGLVMLVVATVILPPVNKLMDKKWRFYFSGGIKVVVVIVGLIIASYLSDSGEQVNQVSIPAKQQRIVKKEVVQKTKETTKKELTKEMPYWHGKIYKITTIDQQEGMEDYDVGLINAWPSYNNRNKVLFKLVNNESVSLVGYNSNHDYCQVKKDKQIGWIACGWIQNLPNDMTDYWEKQW